MTASAPRLNIVCASSLAGGHEAFSTLGSVTILPESDINRDAVVDADILATRSKVKVNHALLAGTKVSFYGTATAGYDHVDTAALESLGIAWSQAPGSNANSVAEYIVACLSRLAIRKSIDWHGKTMAIVGAGQVGSRLAGMAEAIGIRVLLNDPPLRDASGDPRYLPLSDVLAAADIVTIHVPLTDSGPYPTRKLANEAFFASMRPGAVFMNASRGEVVDEVAFIAASENGRFASVVLDVFDHEPDIDPVMMSRADLVSPHVAGYSLDGRLRGTEMIYLAACRRFGISPTWRIPEARAATVLDVPADGGPTALYRTVLQAYDPEGDDTRLRSIPPGISPGRHFRDLRTHYPERKEFPHFAVRGQAARAMAASFSRLGFVVLNRD